MQGPIGKVFKKNALELSIVKIRLSLNGCINREHALYGTKIIIL